MDSTSVRKPAELTEHALDDRPYEASDSCFPTLKADAAACAGFALRGFEVRKVGSGFLAIRWNLTKHAQTIEDLERFARVVGAT